MNSETNPPAVAAATTVPAASATPAPTPAAPAVTTAAPTAPAAAEPQRRKLLRKKARGGAATVM